MKTVSYFLCSISMFSYFFLAHYLLTIVVKNYKIFHEIPDINIPRTIPAVPRKWFESADCGIIYSIYLSLCTQAANSNPILETHIVSYPDKDYTFSKKKVFERSTIPHLQSSADILQQNTNSIFCRRLLL